MGHMIRFWRQEATGSFGAKKLLHWVLLLLTLLSTTEGLLYNTTRLEPVMNLSDKTLVLCVRMVSGQTPPLLTTRLMVQSTGSDNLYTAGNTTVEGLSVDTWHNVTVWYDTVNYVHVLKVTQDGDPIPFNKPKKNMWTSAYRFKEIFLLVKGVVEVTDCQLAKELPTVGGPPTTVGYPPTTVGNPPTTTGTAMEAEVSTDTPKKLMTTTSLHLKSTSMIRPETPSHSTISEKPTTVTPSLSSTMSPDQNPATDPSNELSQGGSWIWSIGAIGSAPALPMIMGILVFVVIVSLLLVICFRKNKTAKTRKLNDKRQHYSSLRNSDPANSSTIASFNENKVQNNSMTISKENHLRSGEQMETFKGFRVSEYHH